MYYKSVGNVFLAYDKACSMLRHFETAVEDEDVSKALNFVEMARIGACELFIILYSTMVSNDSFSIKLGVKKVFCYKSTFVQFVQTQASFQCVCEFETVVEATCCVRLAEIKSEMKPKTH